MTDLTPERIAEAISALRDYIDPHATVEGEAVDLLDHTIATQAKEIERLKASARGEYQRGYDAGFYTCQNGDGYDDSDRD